MGTQPAPIRISFDHITPEAFAELCDRLRAFSARIEILTQHDGSDLILVDPYADGPSFDPSRLSRSTGSGRLVIYTPREEVDPLAFAMAGALLDGRLRGWLSSQLSDVAFVEGLEQIHAGELLLRGRDDPLSV